MRDLIITREKRSVGCFSKTNVYFEDPEYGNVRINGVLCRKIGVIRNGETKRFSITENAVKIFTTSSRGGKNKTSDYYQLYEGSEDVYLSGETSFNPFVNSAFRFHNNNDPGALQNRGSRRTKGIVTFTVTIVVAFVVGFMTTTIAMAILTPPKDRMFKNDNMIVTLTDQFFRSEPEGHTAVIVSRDVAVIIDKEAFAGTGLSRYTEKEYAKMMISSNGLTDIKVTSSDGLTCFVYTAFVGRIEYTYYAYVYKSNDAFWVLQFASETDELGEHKDDFIKYAKSVRFEEEYF